MPPDRTGRIKANEPAGAIRRTSYPQTVGHVSAGDYERILEVVVLASRGNLGLSAASPPVMYLESQIGEFGRGERGSPSLTQRSVRFLLVNRTRREAGSAERSA
jgi:hypothetical protein